MLINLRNALMAGKRLPYDAEVEYLQSSGTQWIDTGIVAGDDTTFSVRFNCTSMVDTAIYGGRSQAQGRQWILPLQMNQIQFGYGSIYQNINVQYRGFWLNLDTSLSSESYTYRVNLDGGAETTVSTPRQTFTNTANVLLFAAWNNTAVGYKTTAKVARFKIWKNGVLVRDFIPVRKGAVGYLYDRVSGKLFGNAGTGDFTCGSDVVPVEYIESHGTEYIDTGTLVEMTDKVDCTFELLAYGNVTLAGGRVDSSNYSLAIWAYTNAEQRIRFDLLSNNHGGIATSIAPTLGQEYKVSKIGERNFVDGVEVQSNPSVAYNPSRPCYLFAMNNGGTASFIGNCRVKDFSIGSKLKYRPVRVGTEGAMMDVLTRRIYRNAGTGAFTYGNDLPYPIPVE